MSPQPEAPHTAPAGLDTASPYRTRRTPRSLFVPVRGLQVHLLMWGDASLVSPERPPLWLCHGYMDVGASFQFMVDELDALEGPSRCVLAPDWRGFGLTRVPPTDQFWFADYLGDLDALLDAPETGLPANSPLDLLGHSMGGNVVMSYAGVRPERIRRLVNLEGFGLPKSLPEAAPAHLRRWLDALKTPQSLSSYDSLAAVAARLRKNNPRLPPARADWLAAHWAERREDGRWHILGDPAHKRMGALPYRVDEVLAAWRRISAPVLWVEGDETDLKGWWGDRYPRQDFEDRLAVVPNLQRRLLSPSGHMLHHDQPAALAAHLKAFLDAA